MEVIRIMIQVCLWRHECERVFSDKLTNLDDKKLFTQQLDSCTKELVVVKRYATCTYYLINDQTYLT